MFKKLGFFKFQDKNIQNNYFIYVIQINLFSRISEKP